MKNGRPVQPRQPIQGARLRKARISRNISGDQLARSLSDAIGEPVSATTVYSWETNEHRPEPRVVEALARLVGIEPGDLLKNTDRHAPPHSAAEHPGGES